MQPPPRFYPVMYPEKTMPIGLVILNVIGQIDQISIILSRSYFISEYICRVREGMVYT